MAFLGRQLKPFRPSFRGPLTTFESPFFSLLAIYVPFPKMFEDFSHQPPTPGFSCTCASWGRLPLALVVFFLPRQAADLPKYNRAFPRTAASISDKQNSVRHGGRQT